MSNEKHKTKHKIAGKKYRALKYLTNSILAFLLILILLILFIRSPWGQDIIKTRLVHYVSSKTNTKIAIDKLFMTFSGNVQLNGLFLEDKAGDTLVYSKTIKANLAIWDMVSGKTQTIDAVNINGLVANVKQNDSVKGFNYNFLIDAFSPPEASNKTKEVPTASTPIHIKAFNFSDINITYKDVVSGIDSRVAFNNFKGEEFALKTETMKFSAEALKLQNADIKLTQTIMPEKNETKEVQNGGSPILTLKAITLEQVKLHFQSPTTGMSVNADIGNFYTEMPEINLDENNFEINQFDLQNSVITVHSKRDTSKITKHEIKKEKNTEISWPEINVVLNNTNLKNNTFGYYVNNQKCL